MQCTNLVGFTSPRRLVCEHGGDIRAVNVDGSEQAALASEVEDESAAHLAPGGLVVYRWSPGTSPDDRLYSVKDDGTSRVLLDGAPGWSKIVSFVDPTGRVFYARFSAVEHDLFVVNADGTNGHAFADLPAYEESFLGEAPDGTVAFRRCASPCLDALMVVGATTIDLGQGTLQGITADSVFVASSGDPALDLIAITSVGVQVDLDSSSHEVFVAIHPGGRVIYRVLVNGRWVLRSVTTTGGGRTDLGDGSTDESFVGIAPNGRVVFQNPERTRLQSVNVDGTDRRLLRESAQPMAIQGFTDGGKVAYLEPSAGSADLFLVDHDGSAPVNLTNSPFSGDQRFVRSLP